MVASVDRPEALIGLFAGFSSTSSSTTALNAAGTWVAQRFTPSVSKTISKVRVYCTAVGGTLDGDDCRLDIFNDHATTFIPDTSQANSVTVTTTPTGAAWIEFTGFSYATTAGTPIWFVSKNAAASPGTNNYTLSYGINTGNYNNAMGQNAGRVGPSRATTADSGANWASLGPAYTFIRVEYNDGTFEGTPIQTIAADTTNSVYSSREVGVKFTVPSNVLLPIVGAGFLVTKTGTPTGALKYNIRVNKDCTNAADASTYTVPQAYLDGNCRGYPLNFSSASAILAYPGDIVRITVAETAQADASSNRFQTPKAVWDSDANSQTLKPFNGTLSMIYYNGTVESADANAVIPFSLALDLAGVFNTPSKVSAFAA